MRYVCTVCGQFSEDGNLWCEQMDCPSGNIPFVLDYGEYLGEVKVIRLLRLYLTAAVYEAERSNGEKILLKVAHRGFEEDLKRESGLLANLAKMGDTGIAKLQPAYVGSTVQAHPYGKAVFRDENKYYAVFEFTPGEFLRDVLHNNPQPWYQHSAWIVTAIAKALDIIHSKLNVLHLNINPDIVLVNFDELNVPRITLLDLGLGIAPGKLNQDDFTRAQYYIPSAYKAPELLMPGGVASEASDVYGLGALFYEMLAGDPAYPYRLKQDVEVRQAVLSNSPRKLIRRDLPQPQAVYTTINQAISKKPNERQQSASELGKQVVAVFGAIPKPKRSRMQNFTEASVPVVVLATVVILLLILILALLGAPTTA